ncbi:MAG: MFS transporter [Chloroflexi bacterium]|nr:MFS transporter [Chloroflexota bacterium]
MTTEAESIPLAGAAAPAIPHEQRNPFRVANFRRWWLASIFGGAGVGIQTVTVPLFIRDRVAEDHRALAIAAVLIAQNLPAAFFALVGGVAADRVERRRILVRTYTVAAAVSLGYVALAGGDVRWVWPAFILSAVVGSAGAFTNPARSAMVPQIVSRSMIQNAAIFGTMAFMAMLQFGGPAMGGLLADGLGLTFAFAAEVATLLVAALLFSRIATDTPVPSGRSVFGDLTDGLRYVRTDSRLLGILALGTIPGIFIMGPFAVNISIIVPDVLHQSDKFIGFMWASFGGGILIGSVLMSARRFDHRGALLISSVIIGPMGSILFGLSHSAGLSMAILVVQGILGPAIFINFAVALLQEHAAPRMMGRVMSMYSLAFTASIPLGLAEAGLVSNFWGPQVSIVSSGIICVVIGILCMAFLTPVRRLP